MQPLTSDLIDQDRKVEVAPSVPDKNVVPVLLSWPKKAIVELPLSDGNPS